MNILEIKNRISLINDKSQLVAVTKNRNLLEIKEKIWDYNHFVCGENKAQELRDKIKQLSESDFDFKNKIVWHFIGNLQINKIKYLQEVALIHSITNAEQIEKIAFYADKWGRCPDILLQIHNGEEQKHGANIEQLDYLIKLANDLNINVRGFMSMAILDDLEQSKKIFKQAKMVFDDYKLEILSMGMSGDFQIALQEGSNMVRIGSALFE